MPPYFNLFGRLPDYLRVRGLTALVGVGAGAGATAAAAGAAFAEASTRTSRSSIYG